MTIHTFIRQLEERVENAGPLVYLTLSEAGRLHDYAGCWTVQAIRINKNNAQGYLRSDMKYLLEEAKVVLTSEIADELGKMK